MFVANQVNIHAGPAYLGKGIRRRTCDLCNLNGEFLCQDKNAETPNTSSLKLTLRDVAQIAVLCGNTAVRTGRQLLNLPIFDRSKSRFIPNCSDVQIRGRWDEDISQHDLDAEQGFFGQEQRNSILLFLPLYQGTMYILYLQGIANITTLLFYLVHSANFGVSEDMDGLVVLYT